LQNIPERVHLLNTAAQVVERPLLVGVDEHHKGVSLAAHVLLTLQEVGYELGRIRHQEIKVLVDGENGHDCVAAYVAVLVLQAGADRRHQRLQQLGLLQLAQEAKCGAADELVGMLQVASVGIADEDHLLHELAVWRALGHDLPEDEQQLLDGVVGVGHDKADDCHE